MSGNYVSLHLHTSRGSWLDGLGSPDDYMRRAAELEMPALAVTDHGNLSAWMKIQEAGERHGVKPIYGIEAYQARKTRFDRDDEERAGRSTDELDQRGPHHITMLAEDKVGYQNLIKLSSRAYLEGMFVKPRLDEELLSEHKSGIIATSGCLNGKAPQALLRGDFDFAYNYCGQMQDLMGRDNFLIEIQDHGIDEQRQVLDDLVKIADKLNAPIIATNDCHYVDCADSEIHDLMLAVSTGARMSDEKRFRFPTDQFHLAPYEEMARRFPDLWLKNTLDIAERCNVELNFGELYFPEFDVPKGFTPTEYFRDQVWRGLRWRYGDPPPEHAVERAEYEMGVIERMGFPSYFLIIQDLCSWMEQNGIKTAPGRGSAASSIVAYSLGITKLDPLEFNLRFERFLTEGRTSMPDIDLDIDDRYRDQVIEYTRDKYGHDHVCHIATFSEIKAKNAIRDTARVLDYEYKKGEEVSKLIPQPIQGRDFSIDQAMEHNPEMREAYKSDPDTKAIIDKARGLEGVVRQPGIHAAGVIISQSEITNHIPIMQRPEKDGSRGVEISQWDMYEVEKNGLLKMDYLGLSNLAIISRCQDLIEKRRGFRPPEDDFPWDDSNTFAMLCEGSSLGVFQVESPQMRDLMRSLKPEKIDDIIALVALYRPGPLEAGMDREFIARKHGRKDPTPIHPLLSESLERSYGLMIYQEQILDAAQIIAGFTPQQADDLRKIVGKKIVEKMPEMRERFVEGCKETSELSDKEANALFDQIEGFGSYGFNNCITGDTVLTRVSGSQHQSVEITVYDLYQMVHPPDLESSESSYGKSCRSWVDKFRDPNRGLQVLALDHDGRIRPKRVKDVYFNGVAPTWKITLQSGREITATANHRHMTPDGWSRVDQLNVGDRLVVDGGCDASWDHKRRYERNDWDKGHLAFEDPIASIDYAGEQEVYDLEMDDIGHNFVGNGIVTHNSHAASYGLITYYTAYLKANYPVEYMSALLSTTKSKEAAAPYLAECRRMGLTVEAPSINRSQREFEPADDYTIIFGLNAIDGVGRDPTEAIIQARGDTPFTSLQDFMRRVPATVLNKRTVDHLVSSGAFDELLPYKERSVSASQIQELLDLEKKELGLYVTMHPVESIEQQIQDQVTYSIERAHERTTEGILVLGGIISKAEKKLTRNGNDMWHITVEDLTGSVDCIAVGKVAKEVDFSEGELALVELDMKINETDEGLDRTFFFRKRLATLEPQQRPVKIEMGRLPSYDEADKMVQIAQKYPGDSPVHILCNDGITSYSISLPSNVDQSKAQSLFEELANSVKG